MKRLNNTLYITNATTYASLDGETIVIKKDDQTSVRLPLHNLENIVCFNYQGISPALMAACTERNIGLAFLTPNGRFQARIHGRTRGNILLRKKQYRIADDETQRIVIARSFILGKIYNSRKVIERTLRDHGMIVDKPQLSNASIRLKELLNMAADSASILELMAIEGNAAQVYFSVFDHLILHQKDDFHFGERSRRPPLNAMNALLSFLYTLLMNEAASALETVGLDPYAGFLHSDRPGRLSLALDLMEELRPILGDRMALTLVNRRQINSKGFTRKESGGVIMDDETRKTVLQAWQERKKEEITHPYLKERIPIGLIPHIQAMLLARHLRGDLDAYPPFFWN